MEKTTVSIYRLYELHNGVYYELSETSKRFTLDDFPPFLQERIAMLLAVKRPDGRSTYVPDLGVVRKGHIAETFFEVIVTTEEMEMLREMQR
jgi:hypothetical protein